MKNFTFIEKERITFLSKSMLLPYIRPIIRKVIISKFMLLSGYQLSGFEAVEVGIISSATIKKVRLSFI